MTISSAGVINYTPSFDLSGGAQVVAGSVTITVDDGIYEFSRTVSLVYKGVNDAPVITSTAGATATEGVQYTYTAVADDSDGPDVSWRLENEPTGMVVSNTGVVTWTPLEGESTSDVVTLYFSDGVAETSQTLNITVTAVNDAPVITSTASTSAVENVQYTYTATVSDPDDSNNGTDLIWSLVNEPSGMSVSSTGVVTWTPAEGVTTSGSLTLQVSDGGEDGVAQATQSFTINVSAVNTAPTITSTAGATATEDVQYTYTAIASDLDDSNNGTDLTWSLINAPAGMSVSSTGVVTWTPTEGITTSGTVTLQVADGGENGTVAATESFIIIVSAVNDSPVITSTAGTSATEETQYTYIATVSDPDDSNNGTDLTWSLTNPPAGMVVSSTGVVTWTPTEGIGTSGSVTLQVSDGGENGAVIASEIF